MQHYIHELESSKGFKSTITKIGNAVNWSAVDSDEQVNALVDVRIASKENLMDDNASPELN